MCSFHISRKDFVVFQLVIVLCTASAGQRSHSQNHIQISCSNCEHNKLTCPLELTKCTCKDTGKEYCTKDGCKNEDCSAFYPSFTNCAGKSDAKSPCNEPTDPNYTEKFDITRDIIIPAVILMTLGATVWLGFKLFCNNCGKRWRRRRPGHNMPRALEEAHLTVTSTPTTWMASYRVFGPISGVETQSFPPCLLLPAGPPPYEEALKHKVILSSYHPPMTTAAHPEHAQL